VAEQRSLPLEDSPLGDSPGETLGEAVKAGGRAEPDRSRWLTAGRVGRPHGLDGSFHVHEPRAELLPAGGTVDVDGRTRGIERRAGTDARPILRLEGCADRSAAEALRGRELRVEREAAPALGPGEWWAEELEGCRVFDGERDVGVVRRLLALPSCEVLEVERGEQADLLVPLVADAVREVDVRAARIDIRMAFVEPD
jgi:16S rRNA processing protein RimM